MVPINATRYTRLPVALAVPEGGICNRGLKILLVGKIPRDSMENTEVSHPMAVLVCNRIFLPTLLIFHKEAKHVKNHRFLAR